MRREWYWVVLLLMHSGCRALEVIQLLKVNMKQTEDVWCMEMTWIGAEGERQLKNKPSVRTIPIHSGVIRAGVLDWIEQQPSPRLFPSLFPYGAIKTTQWFSAMLEKQGLKRPELTPHSFGIASR